MTERRTERREGHRENGTGRVEVTTERTAEGTVYRAEPRVVTTDVNVLERPTTVAPFQDRLRWGPIVGGLATTIALMLLFTMLGLALGFTLFEPNEDTTTIVKSAAVWSTVSGVLAFFLGGWVTGKTAAVENDDNALINGFIVAAAALVMILFLGGLGLGNLFGIIGGNIGDIAQIVTNNPNQVPNSIPVIAPDAATVFERAENSAWYSLAGLVIGLAAATLGGWVGHKSRHGHELHDHTTGGAG